MRILFTFVGGSGHFDPLVPIARAARAAGHAVAFACPHSMVATVEAHGFAPFVTGADPGDAPRRIALRPPSQEREDEVLREVFAGRLARRRAAGVLTLCAEWDPDLVVCDGTDFGSMVAAERLGLAHVTVIIDAAGSLVRRELVAEPLNALRAEHGLPPDPELEMLRRDLVLSPFPPSLRDPAFPLPATAHSLRAPTPDRARDDDGPPTVYFTLGTVFNLECGDLFARVIEGLRELPIELVVTVGHDIDPEELGPQPANVHIERHVPQSSVLPRCSAVVSHGGSGSVVGALAHGLPQVLLPMGADQLLNAARCEELGLARVLDVMTATPQTVREATSAVLSDATHRHAAERIRDEIAALPGPEYAVGLLEDLAALRPSRTPTRAKG